MKIKFTIILICSSLIGFAQNITGKFVQQNYIDAGITLTFHKPTFTYQTGGSINGSFGTGYYSIHKNELKLKFIKVPKQDTSFYSILSSSVKSQTALLNIKIQDENGNPSKGTVVFRDKDYSSIERFQSDNHGLLSIPLKQEKNICTVTIDNIGYYRVTFPITKLKGKNSEITVRLKPAATNYIDPKFEVYKIESLTQNEIILSTNKSETIRLKRMPE
jgi:hypothetical protein